MAWYNKFFNLFSRSRTSGSGNPSPELIISSPRNPMSGGNSSPQSNGGNPIPAGIRPVYSAVPTPQYQPVYAKPQPTIGSYAPPGLVQAGIGGQTPQPLSQFQPFSSGYPSPVAAGISKPKAAEQVPNKTLGVNPNYGNVFAVGVGLPQSTPFDPAMKQFQSQPPAALRNPNYVPIPVEMIRNQQQAAASSVKSGDAVKSPFWPQPQQPLWQQPFLQGRSPFQLQQTTSAMPPAVTGMNQFQSVNPGPASRLVSRPLPPTGPASNPWAGNPTASPSTDSAARAAAAARVLPQPPLAQPSPEERQARIQAKPAAPLPPGVTQGPSPEQARANMNASTAFKARNAQQVAGHKEPSTPGKSSENNQYGHLTISPK